MNDIILSMPRFYFAMLVLVGGMYACKEPKAKTADNAIAIADSGGIRLQIVTNGIAQPVQMSIPTDSANRMFVTDHAGKIWILKNDSLLPQPFFNIAVEKSQNGTPSLLGTISSIAFHPQFATNHKFYVCYNTATSIKANPTKMVIDEFTEDIKKHDTTALKSGRRVFEMEGKMMYTNGAEIAFGPDGYLYISIGDDAFGDTSYVFHAQDLDYLNGKLLRIDVNKTPYAIPPDNPFIGMAHKRPEIWAYGFRKMWRFCFDPKSKQIYGGDVGENNREEIDIITKAANYGWPAMEGDTVFNQSTIAEQRSFTAPINTYSHKEGICVISGNFYYGREIPFLQGKFVFGDFTTGIFTLYDTNGQWKRERVLVRNKPADPFLICAFDADRNNELYVMGLLNTRKGPKGVLYKIIKG